jgi:DNA-binding MarR family transcriptional regulator
MDASSTVCLLNELEEAQLLERRRDRADRRRGIVVLSPEGEQALGKVDEALKTVEDEILASLGTAERCELHALLSRLNVSQSDWAMSATEA